MPKETYHKQTFDAFTIFFQNGCKKIYEEFGISRKVPLKQVLNAMIEASYNNLSQAILTREILTGASAPIQTGVPTVRYKEIVTDKLMGIMSEDLTLSSPSHSYVIVRVKKPKKKS
jgi:hypothetical protein